MQELAQYREQINQIDLEIVALLNKRAAIAVSIGQCKKQIGQSHYKDPNREQSVIDNVCHHNQGPLSNDAVANIYRIVMLECLNLQQSQ